jgi:hypothetical protein
VILGHPALRLLARRKFSGALRKQVRRLKSVKGLLFAIVGFSAIALWMGSALVNGFLLGTREGRQFADEIEFRIGGTVILAMSLFGALSFRGLYLPREEIELLFAAPISRGDVIRYRLWTSLGKSILGSVFLAVLVMGKVREPLYGFAGTFLLMMTVPILAQMLSLLAGDAENRWVGRVPKGALRALNVGGILILLAIFLYPSSGREHDLDPSAFAELWQRVKEHPVLDGATLPLWPWATLATTTSVAQFLGLFAVCLAFWFAAFELCARMRIDYRELSLETSADVARRLSRMRKGAAGASAGTADAASAGWRIPWLFGRGPFGALAWRKTGTMLRKARGTVLISGALVTLLVIVTRVIFDPATKTGEFAARNSVLMASGVIAFAGTIYLCAGLRFDFREDLDRMDVVRSWPIAPWRVFLATVLPEVAIVSLFLVAAIVVRALISGLFPVEVVAILALVPPAVLAWVSIDNIVFLLWPQRLTPGSEGLLQQAGRSMLLMLLRSLLVVVAGGVVGLFGWLVYVVAMDLGFEVITALGLAVAVGVLLSLLECALLVSLGGKALSRFDVAHDR